MNFLEVIKHFNETEPKGKEMLEFVKANMDDVDLAMSMLILVDKLHDTPIMAFDHEFLMLLMCFTLAVTEKLCPETSIDNAFNQEFNEIIRNIMGDEDKDA